MDNKTTIIYEGKEDPTIQQGVTFVAIQTETQPPYVFATYSTRHTEDLPKLSEDMLIISTDQAKRLFDFKKGNLADLVRSEVSANKKFTLRNLIDAYNKVRGNDTFTPFSNIEKKLVEEGIINEQYLKSGSFNVAINALLRDYPDVFRAGTLRGELDKYFAVYADKIDDKVDLDAEV